MYASLQDNTTMTLSPVERRDLRLVGPSAAEV